MHAMCAGDRCRTLLKRCGQVIHQHHRHTSSLTTATCSMSLITLVLPPPHPTCASQRLHNYPSNLYLLLFSRHTQVHLAHTHTHTHSTYLNVFVPPRSTCIINTGHWIYSTATRVCAMKQVVMIIWHIALVSDVSDCIHKGHMAVCRLDHSEVALRKAQGGATADQKGP